MQEYKDIDIDSLVSDGPDTINKNFKTLMSNNAGGGFPTDNLYAGMTCYRSDEGKIYTLKNDLSTWVELFDISSASGAVAPLADALTKTLSIEKGGTGATTGSDACANIGALPTSGGTMTGGIKFNNNTELRVGGSGTSKSIVLFSALDSYANNHLLLADGNNTDPRFELVAGNGHTTTKKLVGRPDGTLVWNNNEIFHAGKTISIANGGTGATTAIDASKNLMKDGFELISENADLNNYKTPGLYICNANSIVATLSNCPTGTAFIMKITGDTSNWIKQELSLYNSVSIYTREYHTWDPSGWSSWQGFWIG